MSRRAAFGGRLTGGDDSTSSPSSTTSTTANPGQPRASQGQRGQQNRRNNEGNAAAKGKNRPPHLQLQQQHSTQGNDSAAVDRNTNNSERVLEVNAYARAMAKAADEAGETTDDDAICFICAEPVVSWSVSACDHRTCHTCSIRLRALYKKKECTFCKTDCPTVIFTESEDQLFKDYTTESTPFSDTKLGILFESRAQLEDTLSLLRFNCPYKPGLSDPNSAAPDAEDQACDHILSGWSDLKRHVRATHHTTLCDLCCSNKKIFAHEHELFALANPGQDRHNGGGGRGGRRETELDQHLEKQHAMCGFCKRWFYDSDGLYKHCREQHEECFICVRQGVRHQYHLNYDRLEQHYKNDHFLCPHPDCLAQKFVVFESELDLQAHALEVHGIGSFQDQKSRKEARRIETNFVYSNGESHTRSGGAGGDGRRRGGNQGGRAPAASFVEARGGSGESSTVATPSGERRIPGLGAPAAGGSRAARFGGQLTGDPSPTSSGATTPLGAGDSAAARDVATLERHAALLRRVQDLTHGHEGKIAGFKIAARSFRNGELNAHDFVDQLYNVLDQRTDDAETVILGFADLLDQPDKKRAVQIAWRDLRSENNFPSLAPLAPTLHGQPTAVHATSHRALSAQHRTGHNPSTTWDRVERAATSSGPAPVAPRSNPFPALMSASNTKSIPGLAKAGQQTARRAVGGSTPWSSSSASAAGATASLAGPSAFPSLGGGGATSPGAFPSLGGASSSSAPASRASSASVTPRSISRPASTSGGTARRPASGLDFPSLPTSSSASDSRARMRAALAKPQARAAQTILTADDDSWGAASGSSGSAADGAAGNGGGKKKGKGRQKVVLMSGGLASQPN
ncbi:hypothetical protein JCM3775_003137 [Rhodotorula graminis]